MTRLDFTRIGTYWNWGGTLFHVTHPDGREARVFVDDLGETWVDIRVIPEGGFFHSERVEAYRVFNGAEKADLYLRMQGFGNRRTAQFAHRVHERPI